MALKTEFMGAGTAPLAAGMAGHDTAGTIAGAGTTQGTATAVVSNFTLISTAPSSSGVVLMTAAGAAPVVIYNGGANTLKVYGSGTQTINGIAGSTGFSVTTLKAAQFRAAGTGWIAILSA